MDRNSIQTSVVRAILTIFFLSLTAPGKGFAKCVIDVLCDNEPKSLVENYQHPENLRAFKRLSYNKQYDILIISTSDPKEPYGVFLVSNISPGKYEEIDYIGREEANWIDFTIGEIDGTHYLVAKELMEGAPYGIPINYFRDKETGRWEKVKDYGMYDEKYASSKNALYISGEGDLIIKINRNAKSYSGKGWRKGGEEYENLYKEYNDQRNLSQNTASVQIKYHDNCSSQEIKGFIEDSRIIHICVNRKYDSNIDKAGIAGIYAPQGVTNRFFPFPHTKIVSSDKEWIQRIQDLGNSLERYEATFDQIHMVGNKMWFATEAFDRIEMKTGTEEAGPGYDKKYVFGYFDIEKGIYYPLYNLKVDKKDFLNRVLFEPDIIWFGVYESNEYGTSGKGAYRYNIQKNKLTRLDIGSEVSSFHRWGDSMVCLSYDGLAIMDSDNTTRVRWVQISKNRIALKGFKGL
jgi:hypothetical protein